MNIIEIKENKKRYIDLLLLADEQEDMIDRYLERGTMYVLDNDGVKAICIYHKGSYDRLGEAYAYIYRYAAENGYQVADFHRECYIDGIWNKENVEDWLTEIQLPVK